MKLGLFRQKEQGILYCSSKEDVFFLWTTAHGSSSEDKDHR